MPERSKFGRIRYFFNDWWNAKHQRKEDGTYQWGRGVRDEALRKLVEEISPFFKAFYVLVTLAAGVATIIKAIR